MARFGFTISAAPIMLVILLGGCSLVVDFDRSLLLDAGVDGSVDSGLSAALSSVDDAQGDAERDASLDEAKDGD